MGLKNWNTFSVLEYRYSNKEISTTFSDIKIGPGIFPSWNNQQYFQTKISESYLQIVSQPH